MASKFARNYCVIQNELTNIDINYLKIKEAVKLTASFIIYSINLLLDQHSFDSLCKFLSF